MRKHLRQYIFVFTALFLIICAVLATWSYGLLQELRGRISKGWFRPSIEIYADHVPLSAGMKKSLESLREDFRIRDFSERDSAQTLREKEFKILDSSPCLESAPEDVSEEQREMISQCFEYLAPGGSESQVIALSAEQVIVAVWSEVFEKQVFLPYRLMSSVYGEDPVLRRSVTLGQVPLACIQSILAIEDSEFLDHVGINPLGIARAMTRNVFAGRWAQGGSTITQQLVKNYFLTPEKTLQRKFKELILSLLLETQVSKDEILQNYLNVAYLGQSGAYQVMGYGAASEFYFQKPIEELDVGECALMAAIVNNPGLYNPFTKQENARKRRRLVLQRMVDLNLLDEKDLQSLAEAPLPTRPAPDKQVTAPFVVNAIFTQATSLGISLTNGGKVYTTIDSSAQAAAQTSVREGLNGIEERNPKIKPLVDKGLRLEGALISADVESGRVLALVGGRDFRKSQFNRAVSGHRQIGSLVKPYVYLAALEEGAEDNALTALSLLKDEKLVVKDHGKTWRPENYDKKFYGEVPFYYALKQSLNVSTVRLAMDIGLEPVVELLQRFGVQSHLDPYPSLALGAAELYIWEVTQAYLQLARFGRSQTLYLIDHAEDLNGSTLFSRAEEFDAVPLARPENVAVINGILTQVMRTGTARAAADMGVQFPAAGKTGTTSDHKDAWFAGFTPQIATVVWVGYDDNTSHKLTGASGALPIWASFMKSLGERVPSQEFPWPPGTHQVHYESGELQSLLPQVEPSLLQESVDLILLDGEEGVSN